MNCPECHTRPKWDGVCSHSPTCSRIDFETARHYAAYYSEKYTKREALWVENYRRSSDRCAALRIENNTLRAKLRKAGILKH